MDATLPRLSLIRDGLVLLQQQMATESQMPEPDYTRFACANPIRGAHGYFAGCADSGAHNTSLLKTPIHSRGGMQHEVALHLHEQGKGSFIKANGAKAYTARHSGLTQKAEEGARTLSAKDKSTLKTHLKTLAVEVKTLQATGKGTSAEARKMIAEMTMMQRQLNRSGTAKTTGSKASKDNSPLKPITTIPGYVHDPFKAPDPAMLSQLYGKDQLGKALRGYTMDMLKKTAQKVQDEHPGTKPTSKASRDGLIAYIVGNWDAPSSKRVSLSDVRLALAELTRAEGNPNHGSDGKFSSSGGGPVSAGGTHLNYTPHVPANWQSVVDHASNPDGHTYVCPFCSKVTNGPMAGQKLGFVPGNDTPVPKQPWSHGTCPRCAEAEMRRRAYHRLSGMGYSDAQIVPILRLMHGIGMKGVYDAVQAQTPSNPPAERLAAIRSLLAEVRRNFTWQDRYGNTWESVQGANGKITDNVLVTKAHGGIPGVTHVSHHEEGMAAGSTFFEYKGRTAETEEVRAARDAIRDHANGTHRLNADEFGTQAAILTSGYRMQYGNEQTNPQNLWEFAHKNPEVAYQTLRGIPTAIMNVMRDHEQMPSHEIPKGVSSRDRIAEEMVKSLDRQHNGTNATWDRNASKSSVSTATGGAKGEPRTKNEKVSTGTTGRTVVTPHSLTSEELSRWIDKTNTGELLNHNHIYDPEKVWQYAHGDPHMVHALLSQGTATGQLEDMARAYGITITSMSRERIAQQITEYLDRQHNTEQARFGNNNHETMAKSSVSTATGGAKGEGVTRYKSSAEYRVAFDKWVQDHKDTEMGRFAGAFAHAMDRHQEVTGFAHIHDLRVTIGHELQMTPKEVDEHINRLREMGDRHEIPLGLHYEGDEETIYTNRYPHLQLPERDGRMRDFDFVEWSSHPQRDDNAYNLRGNGLVRGVDRGAGEHVAPTNKGGLYNPRMSDKQYNSIPAAPSHEAKTSNSQVSQSSASKASTGESIHEKSARLQQEQGLKAEVVPPRGARPGDIMLTPVGKMPDRVFEPFSPPDIATIKTLYGEHQLGAALSRYSLDRLLATPEAKSIPGASKMTKDALVSALTAHVTQGRYSADFRATSKATTAPKASKPVTDTVPRAIHDKLREAHAQLQQAHADLTKQLAQQQREMARQQKAHDTEKARMKTQLDKLAGAKATKTAGGKSDPLGEKLLPSDTLLNPIKPVTGYAGDPSKPHDPSQMYDIYGPRQFVTFLRTLTLPQLRASAVFLEKGDTKAPATTSRADLIRWMLDKTVTDAAGKAAVASTLQSLQAAAAKSGGGKAKGTAKTEAITSGNDDLVPIKTGINYEFDPFRPPRFLRELYGDAQLPRALARYNNERLQSMFKEHIGSDAPKKQHGESAAVYKDRLIQLLADWAKNPITQRLSLAAIRRSLHAIAA
jgi:hypothetical protein